jgi:hypothetical protein
MFHTVGMTDPVETLRDVARGELAGPSKRKSDTFTCGQADCLD